MSYRPIPTAGAATGTTSTTEAEHWTDLAACRDADPRLFYGPDGPGKEPVDVCREREAAAKAICRSCPVLATCRDKALKNREPYGIWGALTEDERRGLDLHGRPTTERSQVAVRAQCGTGGGTSAHRRHGEPSCRICLDYETTRKITIFATRYEGIQALADAGWTPDQIATHYGVQPGTLIKDAHRANHYALVRQIRSNPGRQQQRDTAA